jgi:hypothetical protein
VEGKAKLDDTKNSSGTKSVSHFLFYHFDPSPPFLFYSLRSYAPLITTVSP